MPHTVIKVKNVSKKYCKRLRHTMLYGAADIARSILGLAPNSTRLRPGEFWAVEDISFEVKRGETLGIIGPNGSGKTTILKMLNGIFMPDKGEIRIKGRVGALIEVGAGFHPMLTGRENVYINGSILGMSKKEIGKKFDAIVDFADIGDFIDSPVKHYSSGMHVRLGFAIAVHSEPDILLVDEVLAVGDIRFQRKCTQKIKEIQSKNVSVIFISHNMYMVQGICSKAILLNNGEISSLGEVSGIIRKYEALSGSNSSEENRNFLLPVETLGTGEVEIIDIQLKNAKGKKVDSFSVGESIFVKVSYFAKKRIDNPVFSIGFVRNDGLKCGLSRTKFSNIEIPSIDGKGEIFMEIEKIQLNSGDYLLEFAIADESITNPYVIRKLDTFTVVNPPMPNIGDSCGIYFPKVKWDVSKVIEKVQR